MENGVKRNYLSKYSGFKLPILIEQDEDGFFVVECPVFSGCYTQGETVDEAMKNIREVIDLVLGEKKNQEALSSYYPNKMKLQTITL